MFFAQWGMLAHASTHLKPDPHAAPVKAQFCGECLAFSPLQNAVSGATPAMLAVASPVDEVLSVERIAAIQPRPFDAFRSRAPPVSL